MASTPRAWGMRVPGSQRWQCGGLALHPQSPPFELKRHRQAQRTAALIYTPLRLIDSAEGAEEDPSSGRMRQISVPCRSWLRLPGAWTARLLAGVTLLVGPMTLLPALAGSQSGRQGALRAGAERYLGSQRWLHPCEGGDQAISQRQRRWSCRNASHEGIGGLGASKMLLESVPSELRAAEMAHHHMLQPTRHTPKLDEASTTTTTSSVPLEPVWKWRAYNNGKSVLRGISYSPVPLPTPGQTVLDDDFMGDNTSALWGHRNGGRGDLAIMQKLGANAVRLYGNDPNLNHSAFLDEAELQGLQVIVGFSDYPYIQMEGNCMRTARNCYTQIRRQYALNLRNGFLSAPRTYHRALRTIVLMNEPDLKMETGFIQGLPGTPRHFLKAQLSALDAVLDAEKEAGVAGRLPNFTVAFSFGKCQLCSKFQNHPALGQMWELRLAMKNPILFGYTPRNNLWEAYNNRFVNCFNTANSAHEVDTLFLQAYDEHFQGVPVFIGEYHSPFFFDQQLDLEEILELAASNTSMLEGICFFEYQIRYDKGGGEMNFGMFGLRFDQTLENMYIAGHKYSSWCLKPTATQSRSQCRTMEVDTGYEFAGEGEWTVNISHVPSAGMCCARCHEYTLCQSWTWREDAGLDGVPSLCTLFGAGPDRRLRKEGFVSGAPAVRAPVAQAPLADPNDDMWVHTSVRKAYGGSRVDLPGLCRPDPLG